MEEQNKKNILGFLKKTIYFLSFFVIFFITSYTHAATLYFSPDSGTKQVGKNFSVSVFVSASDQSMNAASGELVIPTDKLEVVSISKSGSIFSLWAQEPSFSAGSVNFEGVVLNPGYSGSAGKIITVTLRAVAAGQATIRLSSGSVLANDGNGTNILKGLGSASFILSDAGSTNTETAPLPETSSVPAAPKVISTDCLPPEGWCISNSPKFSWIVPPGTTGVSILGDRNPSTNPGTKSDGIMSSYTYTGVDEGTWYFHIRLKNVNGWGPTTHYKFQVDTKKPEFFNISLVEPVTALNPQAQLRVQARDGGSGIESYEITIDNNEAKTLVDDGSQIIKTGVLSPGLHTIIMKAKDKAGNYLTSSLDISIDEMVAPTIVQYTQRLPLGEVLTIEGQSYPDVRVVFYIQKDGANPITQSVRTDSNGNFKFILQSTLAEGSYTVLAKAENDIGATSAATEQLRIVVAQKGFSGVFSGNYAISSIIILVLILLPLAVGVYIWHRVSMFKEKIKKQVEDVEKTIHTAFDSLRESTRKQVSLLERVKLKRELTKEESRILAQLKNQLDAAEKFINKEVDKIEKSIK